MTEFLDLPQELLPLIISHIVKPQHLANLCLVNKQFYDFSIPLLYDQIYIYAWHKQGKAKVASLFRTLSEHRHLAKRVHRLELRDFPKAIYSDTHDSLVSSCLKGLSNCCNLRSCTWTRDKTLNTEILGVLSTLSSLKRLEINGHSTGTYDPHALLRFNSLNKISLIMPSSEVVSILSVWVQKLGNSLNSFHVLCKASPLITDTMLEAMAPHMIRLEHLHIAGCPRVTHKGILDIISHNQVGIKSLGLEGLSQSFDIFHLASLASNFSNLTSLTLTFQPFISPEKWSSAIVSMTSEANLEEFHLYAAAAAKMPNAGDLILHPVLESIVPLHSTTLKKISVNRVHIPVSVVGMICSRCHNLESLFVVVNDYSLNDLVPELAKSNSLRNIHVNFPHTGQIGRIPPSEVLTIARRLGSQVRQLGFSNRVYQLERSSRVDEGGNVVLDLELGPYEQPQVPEQFLVVRT